MSEFLKAIQNLPPIKPKVHTVCIQGQNVVVSLERKLEVIRHGEEAYHWTSPIEFALKRGDGWRHLRFCFFFS